MSKIEFYLKLNSSCLKMKKIYFNYLIIEINLIFLKIFFLKKWY